jgi:hypothetical protein
MHNKSSLYLDYHDALYIQFIQSNTLLRSLGKFKLIETLPLGTFFEAFTNVYHQPSEILVDSVHTQNIFAVLVIPI